LPSHLALPNSAVESSYSRVLIPWGKCRGNPNVPSVRETLPKTAPYTRLPSRRDQVSSLSKPQKPAVCGPLGGRDFGDEEECVVETRGLKLRARYAVSSNWSLFGQYVRSDSKNGRFTVPTALHNRHHVYAERTILPPLGTRSA
jgi:hypothetical protein